MQTSDFDYLLPPERIAQFPVEPRDHSRLLVLDRKTGTWQHRHFLEIGHFLRPGDLLVVNESKVFKARLEGTIVGAGLAPARSDMPAASDMPAVSDMPAAFDIPSRAGTRPAPTRIEIFLLHPNQETNTWTALAKPGRKLKIGDTVNFADSIHAMVTDKHTDGTVSLDFHLPPETVFAFAETHGQVPTPPYVEASKENDTAYQTVYAKHIGSVAAPTAGFHFTERLITELKQNCIAFAAVTLHVGLGTFRPIKTDTLETHDMHSEWLHIPKETQDAITRTKKAGGRVIAIGTTTVRALESGLTEGFTNIFITPGYQFKTVDALVTNFHLPKSTLLVLVSSLAGKQLIHDAYQDAIKNEYRFYSFGDAMFIV